MTAAPKNDTSLPPDITKYLAILSNDPGSLVFAPLAEAYRKAGMLDEAIATAQEGLKTHPNYLSAMVALGRAYFEKGTLSDARETLDHVLAVAPDNIIAIRILGEIGKQLEVSSRPPETKGQVAEGGGISEEIKGEAEEVGIKGEATEKASQLEEAELVELEEVVEVAEVEAVEGVEVIQEEEIRPELEVTSPEIEVQIQEPEAAKFVPAPVQEPAAIEEIKIVQKPRPKKEITTETIAELYIKQGYIEKAIDVYQTIHDAHPGNEEIKKKLEELKKQIEVKVEEQASGVGLAQPVSQKAVEDEDTGNIKRLESWLETIKSEGRKV